MVSSVGVSSSSLTLSSSNNVSLSPSSTGGANSSLVSSPPTLSSSVLRSASSSGTATLASLSSVRFQASSVVSSSFSSLSSERRNSTNLLTSSTTSVTSLDQTVLSTGTTAPGSSAQSTSSPRSSNRKSVMVGPSNSTSATASITSESSQASPSESTTASSTSRAQATTDSASSQTVGENQDPTPPVSSSSESSSTAISSGDDGTTATSPTAGATTSTTTHTQIALPSHKTDSGSAAPTASDSGGTVASDGSGASTPLPASPTPSTALSDNGSKASAIAQASNRTSSTTISTVTDQPESTLSSPVFFTVTDSKNRTTISEPPVFTSVEVTTSNGVQVSVTHVVANPTGIWGVDEATSPHGFFSNSGAVAGVFLVVGLIIAAIFAGIYLYFRRRRQHAPRNIESISRPLPMPDDPFEDPRTLLPPPEMHYAPGYADRTLVIAGAATPHPTPSRSPFDSDLDHTSSHSSDPRPSAEQIHGLGLAGVGNGRGLSYGDSSFHSRSGQLTHRSPVGLAITTDSRRNSAGSGRREPSSAQSSPSIYPPSLPTPSGEDDRSLVDVSLGNDKGTARFANASATRLSSPTTRKPVPLHDLPEPVAPVARSPQQQQAEPPVVPPRSPLRRNSATTSRSFSRSPPPVPLSNIHTELKDPELAVAALQPYEPLTPPISLASLSPAGSSSGHEAFTPISPLDALAAANPFSDAHAQQAPHAEIITAFPMTRSGNKRETFYTRTRGSQRRPSVEWRQHD